MKRNSIFFKICMVGIILISYIFLLINFSLISEIIYKCFSILTPFIYGFIIAYLINPLMNKIEKNKRIQNSKNKRKISMLISYTIITILISLIIIFIVPNLWYSINELIKSIPDIANKLMQWLNKIEVKDFKFLGEKIKITELARTFLETQVNEITKNSGDYFKTIFNFTKSISNIVLNFILGIIISIYMLHQKETFKSQGKKITYAYLPEDKAEKILTFLKNVDTKFSDFLVSKSLDSFIIGVICFIGVMLMKSEDALLIAVIVGITNMIPYFGPFIGAIPSAIICLAQNFNLGIMFIVFIIALQQFDGNILGPKLMGSKMNLSAFWIIFAVLITTGIFGIVGMLIGVPLFAVIYMILREDIRKRLAQKGKSIETEDY